MPRKKNPIPSYLLHSQSGQARCRFDGREFLLPGEFGSDESRIAYGQLVAKYAAGLPIDPFRGKTSTKSGEDTGVTVAELLLAFKSHAESYYTKDGKRTAEVDCFYSAMRPVRELYAALPAADFSPLMLKACRERYIAKGWTRTYCNKSVNRVRHIWKWGVSNGLIPVETWQALLAIEPLKAGKCAAPDRTPRQAVPEASIASMRPHLSAKHRDLLDLLRATGARPSELLGLSMVDIDQTGEVWYAELAHHKCEHLGKSRKLFFGPRAKLILRRCPTTGPLFGKIRRDTFSKAVMRACEAAGVTPFVPYALRHTKATELRDGYSIEAAQAAMGHSKADMTSRYSSNMDKLARQAATDCG